MANNNMTACPTGYHDISGILISDNDCDYCVLNVFLTEAIEDKACGLSPLLLDWQIGAIKDYLANHSCDGRGYFESKYAHRLGCPTPLEARKPSYGE